MLTPIWKTQVLLLHPCTKTKCNACSIIQINFFRDCANILIQTHYSCKLPAAMAEKNLKKKLAESSKLRGWYCSGEKQPNTHTVDSVHEPINHNTVLVINTNCPLKYNRPANKATLWPPLVFALKAVVARCRNIPS